jgi:hypothetical protein
VNILSNLIIGVLFVATLRFGVRSWFRSVRGDRYSPKHRR